MVSIYKPVGQTYKIYLDTNVISCIRNDRIRTEDENINFLYGFISASKKTTSSGNIDFPYSDAHLDDLTKSNVKGEREYIERDLSFLSQISSDKCLCLYWNDKSPKYRSRNPKEVFNELLNDTSRNISSIEDFEKILSDAGMSPLIDLFKSMPSEVTLSDLDDESRSYLASIYPRTAKEDSIYNVIADGLDMSSRISDNPEEYKKLKKQFADTVPLDKNIGNVKDNIIASINDSLTKSPLGKDFDGLVALNNKQYSNCTPYHNIVSKYMQLDFVGYSSEKLTDKNKYDNLHRDARHCFYAAYCDVYITNDKKAYKKSEAVYEEENIGTLVMTPEEFKTFARENIIRQY